MQTNQYPRRVLVVRPQAVGCDFVLQIDEKGSALK